MAVAEKLDLIDRQHRGALLQEALRLTHGNESEAEDLVQDTLLKALRHERRGGDIRDRSRRWLLTILTVGLVVWLVVSYARPRTNGEDTGAARRILAERYARGELDTEEYTQRLTTLR